MVKLIYKIFSYSVFSVLSVVNLFYFLISFLNLSVLRDLCGYIIYFFLCVLYGFKPLCPLWLKSHLRLKNFV